MEDRKPHRHQPNKPIESKLAVINIYQFPEQIVLLVKLNVLYRTHYYLHKLTSYI